MDTLARASALSRSVFPQYPQRAVQWLLPSRTLTFGKQPLLMGIVNVTPDSFSDGGHYFDANRAVDHAMRLASDGADILDIGGESTRPYATPVHEATELQRVIPVLARLRQLTDLPISIDTFKAKIAREAIAAGAEIINDVTALQGDGQMLRVACESKAGVCVMHMQGTPQTMQDCPTYSDVVEDIFAYLERRRNEIVAAGMDARRICLDPGIGFGKTHQHNLTLLAHSHRFHALGCPLLVGHSRKGYIGKVLRDANADRTAASVGTALSLARQGIQVLRVHDVAAVRQALLLFEATGGIDGTPLQLS